MMASRPLRWQLWAGLSSWWVGGRRGGAVDWRRFLFRPWLWLGLWPRPPASVLRGAGEVEEVLQLPGSAAGKSRDGGPGAEAGAGAASGRGTIDLWLIRADLGQIRFIIVLDSDTVLHLTAWVSCVRTYKILSKSAANPTLLVFLVASIAPGKIVHRKVFESNLVVSFVLSKLFICDDCAASLSPDSAAAWLTLYLVAAMRILWRLATDKSKAKKKKHPSATYPPPSLPSGVRHTCCSPALLMSSAPTAPITRRVKRGSNTPLGTLLKFIWWTYCAASQP